MQMVMVGGAMSMVMDMGSGLDRDQEQIAVHDTALAEHAIGIGAQGGRRAAQNRRLKAGVMVQMDMAGGHAQRVMVMVVVHQTAGQIAGVVVVDIGQNAHSLGVFGGAVGVAQGCAQQIAHGLRAVVIAPFRNMEIQCIA